MKNIFRNKLKMYEEVKLFCENSSATLASLPHFNDYYNELLTLITSIFEYGRKQSEKSNGITIDKNNKKNILISKTLNLSSRLMAFAAVTNNTLLSERINFNIYKLTHKRETSLSNYSKIAISEASLYLPALAPFGITQQTLDELAAAAAAFDDVIVSPRVAIVNRKSYTQILAETFAKTDKLLYQKLDKLIAIIQFSDPSTYNYYINARNIVDAGKRHISIRGKVLDLATNVPLPNVKILLVEENKQKLTRKGGTYSFKTLDSGNYTLQISCKLYHTLTIPNIPVEHHKITTQNIILTKISNLQT